MDALATFWLTFSAVLLVSSIVSGHVALVRIRARPQRGRKLAIAGLVISYGLIALTVVELGSQLIP